MGPEATPARASRTLATRMAQSKKRKPSKPSSAEAQQQREEARRKAAAERRSREAAEKKRKERIERVRKLITPTLAVIAVFVLSIMIIRPAPEVRGIATADEVEGRALAADETHDYGTATPTSGPYSPDPPVCGVFAEQVAAEDAVAAQRVGAVVLWYSDPAVADELTEYAGGFESHVIVSPNAGIEDPIVATAWIRRKAYDTVAEVIDDDFAGVYRLQRDVEGDCPFQ